MPVYYLGEDLVFPPAEYSDPDGVLAVGGDLSPERLLLAYSSGIFPWYSSGSPIIWWSPDPRFVIYPSEVKISRSMKQVFKREIFEIKFDTSFREVITACSGKRKHEKGTWITSEMIEAYVVLHELGFAHSIEAWSEGCLVGGLYGVSLGGMFFGESMFSRESNASKAAFIVLADNLTRLGFDLIDSQVPTEHMKSFGAIEMDRRFFLDLVEKSVKRRTIIGNWGENPLFKTEAAF
jgi:leucyl/phenylalanyl-tRNA--protein transferase